MFKDKFGHNGVAERSIDAKYVFDCDEKRDDRKSCGERNADELTDNKTDDAATETILQVICSTD